MKMHFKKSIRFQKIKVCLYNIPIIKLLFDKKFALSNAEAFDENSQSVACCTFGMLETRTLTPNRFKNLSSENLNILTTVATIYKSLLKKNCCSLSLWFRVKISEIPLLRLLFWVNFINITVITLNQDNTRLNVSVSTVVLLSTFFTTKKLALSISVGFYKNSLIVACCTFSRFKFRTLTPSRFKNRTNDILKPLSHNCIHQQGFLKQKIVTLHHCRFNLKFLKHCYSDSYFGKHY